ncbi:hypothetical protein DVA44_18225 [Leclercia sp. W17]|nr:hypothetical protein DVA44_18225 [Leclercia sp. W17]
MKRIAGWRLAPYPAYRQSPYVGPASAAPPGIRRLRPLRSRSDLQSSQSVRLRSCSACGFPPRHQL